MWRFAKKKQKNSAEHGTDAVEVPESQAGAEEPAAEPAVGASDYDPVEGDFGPFDGDSVDYRQFDFSDFAKGGLDLGSLMVPVPHEGEVQVEMGPTGPQMVHIVTPFGRITPVAFAAPKSTDMWEEAATEILQGMAEDGLQVSMEQGPWGQEVHAESGDAAMHVIGVSGPRWMLRMTLAGPGASSADLVELTRQIIARTFVMRGKDPIPAGTALPVQIPQAMADELRRHLEAQAQAQAQSEGQGQA
ncbi:DUF3710 domain-containing protein [Corynebacterium heidelbergense]|uniref:DUF3710 domain-containing protein n=1 Tax=Corynebacterium heidelbergense TaxID=2055947 RepID=A0A364V5E9_9CORY|nr:DUF3710 domain-containing protein [Corynebacterium heidelbergense]RAV31863.1 DUF3710 domain-containing protein [Corynebacterium heidelbergense]